MAIRGIDDGISSAGGSEGTNPEHTVQQGDTFDSIAEQYNISSDALLKINPQIRDANSLQPGQILNVPLITSIGLPGSDAAGKDAAKIPASMFQSDAIEPATPEIFENQPQKISEKQPFDGNIFSFDIEQKPSFNDSSFDIEQRPSFNDSSFDIEQRPSFNVSTHQFQTDPNGKLVTSNKELIGLLRNLQQQH